MRLRKINPDNPDWFRNTRFVLKSGMEVITNEDGVPVIWSIPPRPFLAKNRKAAIEMTRVAYSPRRSATEQRD